MRSRTPRFGVGVDTERVARFRRPEIAENKRLLTRVYTLAELRDCGDKAQSLAARWAAKEAVFKALCRFGPCALSPRQIEVRRTRRGLPSVKLPGTRRFDVQVSLSHTKTSAVAFAVAVERA